MSSSPPDAPTVGVVAGPVKDRGPPAGAPSVRKGPIFPVVVAMSLFSAVTPAMGGLPVRTSQRVAPSANTSARPSTDDEAICSGGM